MIILNIHSSTSSLFQQVQVIKMHVKILHFSPSGPYSWGKGPKKIEAVFFTGIS